MHDDRHYDVPAASAFRAAAPAVEYRRPDRPGDRAGLARLDASLETDVVYDLRDDAPAIRFYQRHGFVCCGLDATLYDPRTAPGAAER
ncbi:hypothetical protein tb265_16970 [Gemmatimonadetes bacterium T265]|nr:hypothetical protein tb265_16970 [Gemmatimonadetes bacterium T265]